MKLGYFLGCSVALAFALTAIAQAPVQGPAQGGQRPAMGQGGQRPGMGQGGQRPGMGQGGQRQGAGQGGPRSSVNTVSQIQEKFPDEYKAAQALRQSDPAAYRAKMRELQQKADGAN